MKKHLHYSIIIYLLSTLLIFSCDEAEISKEVVITSIYPFDSSDDIPLDLILDWDSKESNKNVSHYEVLLGENSEALNVIGKKVYDSHFTIYELAMNTTYYWKIREKSGDKTIAESDTFSFKTMPSLQSVFYNQDSIYILPVDFIPNEEGEPLFIESLFHHYGAFDSINGVVNTSIITSVGKSENQVNEALFAAAKYCDELNLYGYSDWYLPSVGELDRLIISLGLLDSLRSNYKYLSSTEVREISKGVYLVSQKNYPGKSHGVMQRYGIPSNNFRCRCARKN